MTEQKRIVVGVDGSDSARAALRWAMQHAQVSGARVEAVMAWRHPATYDWEPTGVAGDFEGAAQRALSEELSALEGLEPGVTVVPAGDRGASGRGPAARGEGG